MGFVTVQMGASKIAPESRLPLIQCVNPAVKDEDAEPFGDLPVMAALGLTALPYPRTAEGWCEGLVAEEVGGLAGVIVGMRDKRTGPIYGELAAGDVALHSVGPKLAASLFLKETRKQVVLRTKDTAGKDMIFGLDGAGDKVTISAYKCLFEMTRGRVRVGVQGPASNCSIELTENGAINLNGSQLNLNIGGQALPANQLSTHIGGVTPSVPYPLIFTPALPVMAALAGWLKKLLARFQLGTELARVAL